MAKKDETEDACADHLLRLGDPDFDIKAYIDHRLSELMIAALTRREAEEDSSGS